MNKTMRILWFANTPSLAEEKLFSRQTGGGWIKSLESEIKKIPDVQLAVAFFHPKDIAQFDYNGTRYYPIFQKKINTIVSYYRRFRGIIERKGELQKYLDIISDFKPDIIHVHGTEEPFGLIQQYIKTPVVISIQGNINIYKQKYFSGISRSDVKANVTLKNRLRFNTPLKRYLTWEKRAEQELTIFKYSKYIIGRTEWDRKITMVLSPDRKYFHGDEILRDSFYELKWENKKHTPIKLFTTTGANIYKGIETILGTARLLDNLNIDYEWQIAGLEKNHEIVELARKSLNIKVSDNISFLGRLDENELATQLMQSHIYIMPSHIENSPNSLCEALIIGLPSIAAYSGGTGSLLINNEEGILVQDGDPYIMAGSIVDMVNNYEEAIEMGEKAKHRAIKRHNREKIKNELINVYQSILEIKK